MGVDPGHADAEGEVVSSALLAVVGSLAAMNIVVLSFKLIARAFLRRELRLLRRAEAEREERL